MPAEKSAVEGIYEKNQGSGVWYVRYRLNGKLVRKAVGKKQAAIDHHRKVKVLMRSGEGYVPSSAKGSPKTDTQIAKGSGAAGAGVLLSVLCDEFASHIKNTPKKYKDQRNPPDRIAMVRAEFGDRVASTILPYELTDWLDSLKTKGGNSLAPATWNRMKATISAIYQRGKHRAKITVNPARDFKQQDLGDPLIRFLTHQEEARLRAVLLGQNDSKNHLSQYQEPLFKHRMCELDIALKTGMRKGEQYGLKWKDVDFGAKVVTLLDTKNGKPRLVFLLDDVMADFKILQTLDLQRKAGRKHPAPEDMVFAIGDNKKWWATALKEAKITNFRWHDLRHTFCSRLAQNGASLKIIQEAAGHKTIAMSARYAHMDQTSVRTAMAAAFSRKTDILTSS